MKGRDFMVLPSSWLQQFNIGNYSWFGNNDWIWGFFQLLEFNLSNHSWFGNYGWKQCFLQLQQFNLGNYRQFGNNDWRLCFLRLQQFSRDYQSQSSTDCYWCNCFWRSRSISMRLKSSCRFSGCVSRNVWQDFLNIEEISVAIAEAEHIAPLRIYPNPVSNGRLTISSEQFQAGAKAEIYTVQGVQVGSIVRKVIVSR